MGCLLAYKDPISFLIIRANGPTCRANRPDTAKRQRSILSFFGNANGPTQQKNTADIPQTSLRKHGTNTQITPDIPQASFHKHVTAVFFCCPVFM